jgi:DNA polymerase-3 subunit chi
MPRATFYRIEKGRYRDDPLMVVCILAGRVYQARQPLLILARDDEQAQAIDEKLWEFDENAYIPHQIAGDADDAVTAVLVVPPGVEADDRPLVINLRDEPPPGAWERVLEVVPADEALRAAARERWKAYKARGVALEAHDI